MKPEALYIIGGLISLTGFKGTHNVVRAPPTEQPGWALSYEGQQMLHRLLTVSAVSGIFITVYGFAHLDWWIPLACLIVGFPFTYQLMIRPIIGDIVSMTVGTALSVVAAIFVALEWFL